MSDSRRPYADRADSHSPSCVDDTDVRYVRADAIDRAERTLDLQRERFDRIDRKASGILRFVAALSGVVFAVTGSSDSVPGSRLFLTSSPWLAVAGLSLFVTVFLAALTYVTTRFRSSFTAGTTDLVRTNRVEEDSYRRLVLGTYAAAIRENRVQIQRNERLFVTTLCLLVLGVTGLVAALAKQVGPDAVVSGTTITPIAAVCYLAFLVWAGGRLFSGRVERRRQRIDSERE